MKPAVASILVVALGACGATVDDKGYGEGLGTPESPVPADDSRPYEVASRIDFTVEAILPAQIELAVVTLRAFSDNPARTLITVADQAGVPALAELYSLIPGFLKDRLEGWINDEIAKIKINGKTLPQYAGEVAALAETALTQFGLDSTMTLAPGTATHTLTGLDFTPAGLDVKLPIPGLAGDILTQQPSIMVAEGGALSIGDQHFGLQYGEYAWQGINVASGALFGGDVRTTLGKAINCPALAKTIASKCALGVCVGHEAQLKAVCEGGLDALVDQVHQRIAAFRLDVFRFITGAARLVDDDQDGVADRIVDGTWDSEMNLGMGLRRAPATFTAAR
jgi:hypothetical protein